jgi:hypothetical protein
MSDEFPSPDGQFRLVLEPVEMRMSHWIMGPALLGRDETLFDLRDSLWSAEQVTWSPNSRFVTLKLRRYPGDRFEAQVSVDVVKRLAWIRAETGEQARTGLAELRAWLEAYYQRSPQRNLKT